MTMARLIALLMMLVLVVANGPAVAAAICQHQDSAAHAAAVQSGIAAVSAEALSEEAAVKAASIDGALGEAASTLLVGFMLPSEPTLFPPRIIESASTIMPDDRLQAGRSVPPLLEPPLA